MTGDGEREAAEAEVGRADEELRAVERLLEALLFRIALTRAYFAVFYAICARLYADGFELRIYSGTLHLFNAHYVKAGCFEASTSRLVVWLQKFREEADYAQAFVVDEAGAREEIAAARRLVERIRQDLV